MADQVSVCVGGGGGGGGDRPLLPHYLFGVGGRGQISHIGKNTA